jgi:hypothetical protein
VYYAFLDAKPKTLSVEAVIGMDSGVSMLLQISLISLPSELSISNWWRYIQRPRLMHTVHLQYPSHKLSNATTLTEKIIEFCLE